MGLSCGIVGLPNVGKSTLFNALTSKGVEASNYPFCTIDPNVGIVQVPDDRLDKIASIIASQKKIPATVEFVDIAGLVKGASQGEGLGNQFLSHIRQVGAIAHVVRCFEDENVVHVHGKIDPLGDIEVIETELMLSDLDTVSKAMDKIQKQSKSGNKEILEKLAVLKSIHEKLGSSVSLKSQNLLADDLELVKEFGLLSLKPVVYVCNVLEDELNNDTEQFLKVKQFAKERNAQAIKVCAKIESEIAQLGDDEKKDFLKALGLKQSGLDLMIQTGYQMLGLITYFTAGPKESRAWTILKGTKAPQAAGVIHSDFEKGFIRAEVYDCEALFEHQSEANLKAKGLMRVEGKDYTFKDGDVAHFRFNV